MRYAARRTRWELATRVSRDNDGTLAPGGREGERVGARACTQILGWRLEAASGVISHGDACRRAPSACHSGAVGRRVRRGLIRVEFSRVQLFADSVLE